MPLAHKLRSNAESNGETLEDSVDVDPDHPVESQQTMDFQQLLQKTKETVKMSEWKQVELENGYKRLPYVTQDVPAKEFNERLSNECPKFVRHK